MLIHRISKSALADDSQRPKEHFYQCRFTGENNTDSSSANAEARDSRDPRSPSRSGRWTGEISNNEIDPLNARLVSVSVIVVDEDSTHFVCLI